MKGASKWREEQASHTAVSRRRQAVISQGDFVDPELFGRAKFISILEMNC